MDGPLDPPAHWMRPGYHNAQRAFSPAEQGARPNTRQGEGNPRTFSARVVTNTNHTSPMKSTRAPGSSPRVQRGLNEMPDVAT